jgi:hypothetical protein
MARSDFMIHETGGVIVAYTIFTGVLYSIIFAWTIIDIVKGNFVNNDKLIWLLISIFLGPLGIALYLIIGIKNNSSNTFSKYLVIFSLISTIFTLSPILLLTLFTPSPSKTFKVVHHTTEGNDIELNKNARGKRKAVSTAFKFIDAKGGISKITLKIYNDSGENITEIKCPLTDQTGRNITTELANKKEGEVYCISVIDASTQRAELYDYQLTDGENEDSEHIYAKVIIKTK